MLAVEAGRLIGREFVIERLLGSGGMGSVYVALQRSTGVRRAVKLMRPEILRDPKLRARFAQEARVGSAIGSDHVVHVITAGIDEATSTPFLVMELLEGKELSAWVSDAGAIDVTTLATIFKQLCHAVAAAHATGIVHRDLKPENIFMARSRSVGADFVVKVLDFGIAKLVAEARAGTTDAMGTPLWMAPEQTARGSLVSPQTDVWALGLIAFFCLTGHSYWSSADERHPSLERILRQMLVDDLIPPSGRAAALGVSLPSWFDSWFGSCVHRDPKQRFADAGQVWNELSRCIPVPTARLHGNASLGQLPRDATAPAVPATLPFEPQRPDVQPATTVDAASLDQPSAPTQTGRSIATAKRNGHRRGRLSWIAVALGLAVSGLVLRAILEPRSSGLEASTTAAVTEPGVSAVPDQTSPAEIVVSKVRAWNTAHTSIDGTMFARLYADSVLYYGTRQTGEACVKGKRAFLTKNADFRQEIAGEISTQNDGDDVRADFLKRVTLRGEVTDYPSYLVLRHFGSDWLIVTEGDTVTDANLARRAAKQAADNEAVLGDFDGNGHRESLRLIPPRLPEPQTEENFGDCIGACNCRLTFSDARLPAITVKNCISGYPVNEGDLNDDGSDEIGLLPGWWTSCWHAYRVYTFKDGGWSLFVDPISTHCIQWDQGVDAISKDPRKPGYVTVRFTDDTEGGFAVKTKSVRVR